ncbi:uncharacterized protein PG986_013580 [Apiospora aurea]|uniref:Uncharacterized protein n=1 Tax=Apiospora aurea TaxID=335848 RepID=A0ABR1PVX9_9PEZI
MPVWKARNRMGIFHSPPSNDTDEMQSQGTGGSIHNPVVYPSPPGDDSDDEMQDNGDGESDHSPAVYSSPPSEDNEDNEDNDDSDDSDDGDEMEISGDDEALDDPERPQLRIIVQPPTYMDEGTLLGRPLVVLGPLDVAYYALNGLNLETDEPAELGRRKSVLSSDESESGRNAGMDNDDPDFHVQPEALRVGLVRPSEHYRSEEEPQGYGYAIWHNLSFYSNGDDLRFWIRAMDARGEVIAGITTDAVFVESIDSNEMVGQPDSFVAASQVPAPLNV